MLDDEHRIAELSKTPQGAEKLRRIFKMKSGRRLIEYVERFPRIAARKFSRELHALRFAAREGRSILSEPDVAEPHVGKRIELADDLGLLRENCACLIHGEIKHVGN